MTCLRVFDTKVLPVEQRRKAFNAVALVDALTASLLAEGGHIVGELIDRIFNGLASSIDDIATLVLERYD